MPKTINLEKIKEEFSKGTIPQMLESWEQLGKHLHEKIEEHRIKIKKEDEELKTFQGKINGK